MRYRVLYTYLWAGRESVAVWAVTSDPDAAFLALDEKRACSSTVTAWIEARSDLPGTDFAPVGRIYPGAFAPDTLRPSDSYVGRPQG